MKKSLLFCISTLLLAGILVGCSTSSMQMSTQQTEENILKDSLLSFLNEVSKSISTEPLFQVDSITVTKTRDTLDNKTFGGGRTYRFYYAVWDAGLIVKKDFKMVELLNKYHQKSFSTYNRYNNEIIEHLLTYKDYKAGDKINIKRLNSFLMGDADGGNIRCWTLFDNECPGCYGE